MNALPTLTASRTQAQQALCELLAHGDDVDRSHACRALGSVGDRRAVTALIERLRDADPDVRSDAVAALGRLGDASATGALIESLRLDPDGEVKVATVEALGRIGGNAAVTVLLDIAARRPDDFGYVADVWDPWWDMQLKAVEALGRLRVVAAVAVLTALLDDDDGQDIESELLTALARIGAAGEPVLLTRLTQGAPRQRRRAAHALRLVDTPTAVSALGRAMMDPAPEVRAAAAQALAEAGAARYLPAILLLFRDQDAEVRNTAVRAADRLSGMAGDTGLPAPELTRLIRDDDPRVRAIALTTLARGTPDLDEPTIETLVAGALGDPQTEAAAAACRLLGQVQNAAGVTALIRVVTDEARAVQVRCAAATALGRAGLWNDSVASTLTAACVAAQAPLRLAALDALMALESVSLEQQRATTDADSPAPLADATQSVLMLLRSAGADNLPADAEPEKKGSESFSVSTGSNDGTSAPENDSDPFFAAPPVTSTLEAIARTNREVALALDEAGAPENVADLPQDAALEPYLAIVKNNDTVGRWLLSRASAADIATDTRRLAARVLGRSRHPDTVAALIATLGDADTVLRGDAARSLAAIARRAPQTPGLSQAAAALIQGLASSERDERTACAEALGVLGGRGALAALLIALGDADAAVRDQAMRALAGLATDTKPVSPAELETIVTHLLRHLEDGEAPLRATAASQLAGLVEPLRAAGGAERVRYLIEAIVTAGLAGDGGQARAMGQALRRSGADSVADVLLPLFGSLGNSRQRRALMEMLEAAFTTEDLAPATA